METQRLKNWLMPLKSEPIFIDYDPIWPSQNVVSDPINSTFEEKTQTSVTLEPLDGF